MFREGKVQDMKMSDLECQIYLNKKKNAPMQKLQGKKKK